MRRVLIVTLVALVIMGAFGGVSAQEPTRLKFATLSQGTA